MIEFDKVYGKNFAKGIIPDIEDVKQKFNITDSTAGKVTTRLAQWYGGQDFKNTQLQNLKRNKVTSNRMFKTIEKSQFGNPYRDGLYRISLETIDSKLGNKQGTFEKFKTQAKQILKDNKIPIYDPKMGKDAFGFNINEIAGVTGSAKSKAAEFSQFVDVMDGNINTKAMAGFQSKFSTARQLIESDPSKLSSVSKTINNMAKDLEMRYGVNLPRLRDPDATKYFSPERLRELNAQGLDIVKAAERAGYTVEMPKSAQTIQEFIKNPKNLPNVDEGVTLGMNRIPKKLLTKSLGDMAISLGSPTALLGLNAYLGVDPTKSLDRAILGTEAALAPAGLKALMSRLDNIKNPIVRKSIETAAGLRLPGVFTPANVMRAARFASPVGIATLAGEGLYQLGKLGYKEQQMINEMRENDPEAYQRYLAEQQELADVSA